jgi:DNA-binding transcriptional LysR family regulator
VAFNYDIDNRFGLLSTSPGEGEHVLCTVNTAQAALDLVASGVGIAVLSEDSVQPRKDIAYVPVKNWHQALYMCILYDKWLEPPVWDFVENLVKSIRIANQDNAL